MRYLLEFTREVVTRDGYSIEVEAESQAAADQLAENMTGEMDHSCPDEAAEIGPTECRSWSVADVTPIAGNDKATNILRMPVNAAAIDRNSAMTLPADVWEGLLRAAQIGLPKLGTEDRAAIAAVATLKAHVEISAQRISAAA